MDSLSPPIAESEVSHFTPLINVSSIVLLSISDHWTRVKANLDASKRDKSNTPYDCSVIGMLVGKCTANAICVTSCFEVCSGITREKDAYTFNIDVDFFKSRKALFEESQKMDAQLKDSEFLGFYTANNSSTFSSSTLMLDKLILQEMKSPVILFLMMDVFSEEFILYEGFGQGGEKFEHTESKTPESVIPACTFRQTSFSTLPFDDSIERVGIQHVVKNSVNATNISTVALSQTSSFASRGKEGRRTSEDCSSAVFSQLCVNENAMLILRTNIRIIKQFCKDPRSQKLNAQREKNAKILLQISFLLNQLSSLTSCSDESVLSSSLKNDASCSDLFITYLTFLASLTQTTSYMNKAVGKFNLCNKSSFFATARKSSTSKFF